MAATSAPRVSVGPNLVRSCRQRAPSCGKLELSWTRPNISPTRRNGANLGSSCVQDSATWAQVGPSCQPGPKLGPTRANFADSVWHAENWRLYRYVQCFLALMRVHSRPCPTSAPAAPTCMLSSTCTHTCPSCAMLDPSWAQVAQVGANWPEFGANYAQVPVRFWLGRSRPAFRREATQRGYNMCKCAYK